MRDLPLIRKYAAAIFDIALDCGEAGRVLDDMERLCAALTADGDVFRFFQDPTVSPEEKEKVLCEAVSGLTVSERPTGLCKVMIANGRMEILPDVTRDFRRMVDEYEGRTDALVTTARELRPDEQERIRKALSAQTGKSVELKLQVDESLIGGVVVRIGNTLIDGSVSGRLRAFAEEME